MKKAYLLLTVLVALLLVASGCDKYPAEELAAAEQAVQEAKAAGAQKNCPEDYMAAEGKLAEAKQAADVDKDYEKAKADAATTIGLADKAKKCEPPATPPPPPPPPPPPSKLSLTPVYFDLDRYNIRPDSAVTLKNSKAKMSANTSLIIEGHCDERGTAEYNMALGERRAKSVKNYLISLGASGKGLMTVSFGEKKPVAMGHNEAAWAKNRRVEFKDTTK